jgi:hypothetical protein
MSLSRKGTTEPSGRNQCQWIGVGIGVVPIGSQDDAALSPTEKTPGQSRPAVVVREKLRQHIERLDKIAGRQAVELLRF